MKTKKAKKSKGIVATLPDGRKFTATSMRDLQYQLRNTQVEVTVTNSIGDTRKVRSYIELCPSSEDCAFAKATAVPDDWAPRCGSQAFEILVSVVAGTYKAKYYHTSPLSNLKKCGYITETTLTGFSATQKGKDYIDKVKTNRKEFNLDLYQWRIFINYLTDNTQGGYRRDPNTESALIKEFTVLGLVSAEPVQLSGIPLALENFCKNRGVYLTELGYNSFKEMLPTYCANYMFNYRYYTQSEAEDQKLTNKTIVSLIPNSEMAVVLVTCPHVADYLGKTP